MNLFFVAIIATVLIYDKAWACSPPLDWSLEQEFKAPAYVFRATAVRTDAVKPAREGAVQQGEIDFRYVRVFFELEEDLKGKLPSNSFALTWNAYGGGCGVPVVVGLSYVFFVLPVQEEAKAALVGELANGVGVISIFGTRQIPQNPDLVDKAMAPLRALK